MSNLKKYNIYVFLNSFTRVLSNFFIPLILYDKGLSIQRIILFYDILYLLCMFWIIIYRKLSISVKTTTLMFISSISFTLTYYYLKFLTHNIYDLFLLAFLFSNYIVFNNIGRHIFALGITKSKRTTENTSLYQIFNILGTIFSSFLSVKVIKNLDSDISLILIFSLMMVSIIPLISLKTKETRKDVNIIKTFPKKNYLFISIDQLRNIAVNLFPLYVYIYIVRKYTYVTIVNVVCGFGSIIYIYFISKKMDKNKKNYLRMSLILLSIVYIFKINIFDSNLFLIVIFFECIFKSSLDVITLRNVYIYAKNYSVKNYMLFIEFLSNISKVLFLSVFYIMNINLKVLIVITIVGMLINSMIRFDDGKYGYSKMRK